MLSAKAKMKERAAQDKQGSMSVEEAMNVLLQGYVKGGSSGSGIGVITKGGGSIGPDIRVGVALSYIGNSKF